MATVTKGRTFVSGEVVTPTKLNTLVDSATVTNIVTSDISNLQITTAKLADANITPGKLSTGAPTWDTSGNVGIGTSSPNAKLEVNNTSSANGLRVTVGAGAYSGNVALFGVTGQSNGYQITKDAVNNITHIFNVTAGAEAMRINSSGNVGIGTNNPAAELVVQGGNDTQSRVTNGTATVTTQAFGSVGAIGTVANNAFSIIRNSATQMTFETGGNINAQGNPITNCPTTARAWVNFNGGGTFSPNPSTTAVRSGYNVSSILRVGTGMYTVNLSTPITANYSVVATCSSSDSIGDAAVNHQFNASAYAASTTTANVLVVSGQGGNAVYGNAVTISVIVFSN
jgi:hypothetical protein